jgi:hypothetical protein
MKTFGNKAQTVRALALALAECPEVTDTGAAMIFETFLRCFEDAPYMERVALDTFETFRATGLRSATVIESRRRGEATI